MSMIKVSATLGYFLLLFLTFTHESGFAQNKPQAITEASNATFDLKDGDRVVFLGNSLFGNDLHHGYLELAKGWLVDKD